MAPPGFDKPRLPGLLKKFKSSSTEWLSNGFVPNTFSGGFPGRVRTNVALIELPGKRIAGIKEESGVNVKLISGSAAPVTLMFQDNIVEISASYTNVPVAVMGPPGPVAGKPGWNVKLTKLQVTGPPFIGSDAGNISAKTNKIGLMRGIVCVFLKPPIVAY
jgi:hypothetical protein